MNSEIPSSDFRSCDQKDAMNLQPDPPLEAALRYLYSQRILLNPFEDPIRGRLYEIQQKYLREQFELEYTNARIKCFMLSHGNGRSNLPLASLQDDDNHLLTANEGDWNAEGPVSHHAALFNSTHSFPGIDLLAATVDVLPHVIGLSSEMGCMSGKNKKGQKGTETSENPEHSEDSDVDSEVFFPKMKRKIAVDTVQSKKRQRCPFCHELKRGHVCSVRKIRKQQQQHRTRNDAARIAERLTKSLSSANISTTKRTPVKQDSPILTGRKSKNKSSLTSSDAPLFHRLFDEVPQSLIELEAT